MRTLVYHDGALGDFLTTLPAIAFWRERHPESHITFLGRKSFGDFGRACGLFDVRLDLDRADFALLFAEALSPFLKNLLTGFDAAIAFVNEKSPLIRHFKACGIAQLYLQPPFPITPEPIVDYHLRLFGADGLAYRSRWPGLQLVAFPKHEPLSTSIQTVFFQPGSGSPRKNWPLANFISLGHELAASGRQTVWLLGPAEAEVRLPFSDPIWREAPLENLAAALSRGALYVGNDSGITHLAAMVGCPTVALFGPSDAGIWRPFGLQTALVQSKSGLMTDISIADVLATCQSILSGAVAWQRFGQT